MNKNIGEGKSTVEGTGKLTITITETGHEYEIENGKVIGTTENSSGTQGGEDGTQTEEPQIGDKFRTEDYEYCYGCSYEEFEGWILSNYEGWGVRVLDTTKETYAEIESDEIKSELKGKPITSMRHTFKRCLNLRKAPTIPNTVIDLEETFCYCTALTESPIIPEGVRIMNSAFTGCIAMKKVSVIPSTVELMDYTFNDCWSLEGEIEINANPTDYGLCFMDSGSKGNGIVLKGSSTMLEELASTKNNGKVTVAK